MAAEPAEIVYWASGDAIFYYYGCSKMKLRIIRTFIVDGLFFELALLHLDECCNHDKKVFYFFNVGQLKRLK